MVLKESRPSAYSRCIPAAYGIWSLRDYFQLGSHIYLRKGRKIYFTALYRKLQKWGNAQSLRPIDILHTFIFKAKSYVIREGWEHSMLFHTIGWGHLQTLSVPEFFQKFCKSCVLVTKPNLESQPGSRGFSNILGLVLLKAARVFICSIVLLYLTKFKKNLEHFTVLRSDRNVMYFCLGSVA